MQPTVRLFLVLFFVLFCFGAGRAKTEVKPSEYKQVDTNFYLRSDVETADPHVLILAKEDFTAKGDSYFITLRKKAPAEAYLEMVNDWIEPVTPPDMPASLGVPPDAMQIREPQGDVQVALPSAPAAFSPVKDGMTIPNGAVVKTGDNGTAAVVFGGVDSARLAPHAQAAVQETVTGDSRSVEVDLTSGAVFSKVGQRIGEKEEYKVQTPNGTATAWGTDFVTVALSARTDVWIAQGTVQLDGPDGKRVGLVKSTGTGSLKILRYPASTDMHQAVADDTETMTIVMNFIPLADQKIKALRAQVAGGAKITATEKDYLSRIKKVPVLIKLALVAPPAPPPPPPPAPAPPPPMLAKTPPKPVAPAPPPPVPHPVAAATPVAPSTAPPSQSSPLPSAEPPKPKAVVRASLTLHLRSDGKVELEGTMFSLHELKSVLVDIGKATPRRHLLIEGREKVSHEHLERVLAICREAKLIHVTVAKAKPEHHAEPAQPATEVVSTPAPIAPAPEPRPVPGPASPPMAAPVDSGADGETMP
jgi:ferric-dicitrate binding protein FerR (iron transport regulator)/biopolymer transport protein ExbD